MFNADFGCLRPLIRQPISCFLRNKACKWLISKDFKDPPEIGLFFSLPRFELTSPRQSRPRAPPRNQKST